MSVGWTFRLLLPIFVPPSNASKIVPAPTVALPTVVDCETRSSPRIGGPAPRSLPASMSTAVVPAVLPAPTPVGVNIAIWSSWAPPSRVYRNVPALTR